MVRCRFLISVQVLPTVVENRLNTVFSLIIAHVRLLFQNPRFQVYLIIAHARLLEIPENSIKCMIYIEIRYLHV